jgi:hypothetical protein
MHNIVKTRVCSDLDYEEMVADICYNDQTIAMITQENGIDKMEIEIFPPSEEVTSSKYLLDEYIQALLSAKEWLIKMQKLPED